MCQHEPSTVYQTRLYDSHRSITESSEDGPVIIPLLSAADAENDVVQRQAPKKTAAEDKERRCAKRMVRYSARKLLIKTIKLGRSKVSNPDL